MFGWLKTFKGTGALVIALAVVAILLIAYPPYRLFFGISIGIGVIIAGGLQLYYRLVPAKNEGSRKQKTLRSE